MKTITEEQAQKWCNDNGVFLAVDSGLEYDPTPLAYWHQREPELTDQQFWNRTGSGFGLAPFRIASSRPWTEQIWRPEV